MGGRGHSRERQGEKGKHSEAPEEKGEVFEKRIGLHSSNALRIEVVKDWVSYNVVDRGTIGYVQLPSTDLLVQHEAWSV